MILRELPDLFDFGPPDRMAQDLEIAARAASTVAAAVQ